jgi:hypothetical protein
LPANGLGLVFLYAGETGAIERLIPRHHRLGERVRVLELFAYLGLDGVESVACFPLDIEGADLNDPAGIMDRRGGRRRMLGGAFGRCGRPNSLGNQITRRFPLRLCRRGGLRYRRGRQAILGRLMGRNLRGGRRGRRQRRDLRRRHFHLYGFDLDRLDRISG